MPRASVNAKEMLLKMGKLKVMKQKEGDSNGFSKLGIGYPNN